MQLATDLVSRLDVPGFFERRGPIIPPALSPGGGRGDGSSSRVKSVPLTTLSGPRGGNGDSDPKTYRGPGGNGDSDPKYTGGPGGGSGDSSPRYIN